jgi:hypothetical protein
MNSGFRVGSAAVIMAYVPFCSSNATTKQNVKESDHKLS